MNIKSNLEDIFSSTFWLENLGNPLNINLGFNVDYIEKPQEIKKFIYSDDWVNIDLYYFNKLLDAFDKENKSKKSQLDFINQIAIDTSTCFLNYQRELRNKTQLKNITLDIIVHFKEILIRSFQEDRVNEYCGTEFKFFNENLNIFKAGNVSCGWNGAIEVDMYDPLDAAFENIKVMQEGCILVY
ncbi:hypothetical protein EC844_113100 [Acinetobacter calcoaceticus]|uniref:Uncharacterized protein n=1 Tax=Acinetobacter calcoaceticus TaxID=471 RepID=A0A4R1XVI2_ACICA|nr:hypothetical protein EC844_113100 [Acinetobacter calcoaceticus]